jgi:hypothetical protein
MRRLLPRLTVGRLLIAVAIVGLLSASLAGYLTGYRCPLCFSARVVPVYYNGLVSDWDTSVEREGLVFEYGPGKVGPHRWSCRACSLRW